jgi:hypothetical protein
MPLTIIVADDDLQFREIVRYLLAAASDTMTIVGEAMATKRSPSCAACGPTS